jgi:hypothetical protein
MIFNSSYVYNFGLLINVGAERVECACCDSKYRRSPPPPTSTVYKNKSPNTLLFEMKKIMIIPLLIYSDLHHLNLKENKNFILKIRIK